MQAPSPPPTPPRGRHPRRECGVFAKLASLPGTEAVLCSAGFIEATVRGEGRLFLPDEGLGAAAAMVEEMDAALAQQETTQKAP